MVSRASALATSPQAWPIALFALVAGAIALLRYRQTLD
jgi:hypothetical protein